MNSDYKITEAILRDMSEGVLVIGKNGIIEYLNEAGVAILQKSSASLVGKSFGEFIAEDVGNDDFHQIALDAIYEKSVVHGGIVDYTGESFKKKLRITSSFVFNEDSTASLGISIVFSDVTELERLSQLRRESSIIFSSLMACITLYMFIWRAVDDIGILLTPQTMTLVIEIMAIFVMVFVLNTTSLSVKDFNLRLKEPWRQMKLFVLIAIGGTAFLALLKLVIIKLGIPFFPENKPFWDWSVISLTIITYPVTSILQEVLARCMMQNSLLYIFTGKYKAALSIVVSSLIFGAVHIAYGIRYMVAAFLLLSILGTVYDRTRNLWGVALIHFVFGVCVIFMRYTI